MTDDAGARATIADHPALASVTSVAEGLARAGYIASRRIATALYMAANLEKPVLVEGVAGVGKTELALASAALLDLPLVRLQCYEGLDEARALYEWKYGKQLLYTQLLKDHMGAGLAEAPDLASAFEALRAGGDLFFSEAFLEARPLLAALRHEAGAVLLIDEVDKADESFEAFLLEVLSAFQVSIPEIGVIRATTRPIVFLTSNNARDLGDALKRRCLHLHIPLPSVELEERIVALRAPEAAPKLRRALVRFVHGLRDLELRKPPSISETVDWARALVLLHAATLDPAAVRDTLNLLLKFEQDIALAEPRLSELLAAAQG